MESSPSPYINRFLSADTIVPGYANPQNLNLYSYVNNNPLRYTDPTGHRACEQDEGSCLSENQVTQIFKRKHERIREKIRRTNMDRDGKIGDGSIASVGPTPSPLDEIIQITDFGVESMHLLNLVEDGIQWGRPVYRQIKYAVPLGGVEWGIDAGLQLYDDRGLNLSQQDRTGRAIIRGAESGIIDGASTYVGAAAAAALQANVPIPVVSAGVGYVVGSYSTSAILDNFFNQVNPTLFNWAGLGGP